MTNLPKIIKQMTERSILFTKNGQQLVEITLNQRVLLYIANWLVTYGSRRMRWIVSL